MLAVPRRDPGDAFHLDEEPVLCPSIAHECSSKVKNHWRMSPGETDKAFAASSTCTKLQPLLCRTKRGWAVLISFFWVDSFSHGDFFVPMAANERVPRPKREKSLRKKNEWVTACKTANCRPKNLSNGHGRHGSSGAAAARCARSLTPTMPTPAAARSKRPKAWSGSRSVWSAWTRPSVAQKGDPPRPRKEGCDAGPRQIVDPGVR